MPAVSSKVLRFGSPPPQIQTFSHLRMTCKGAVIQICPRRSNPYWWSWSFLERYNGSFVFTKPSTNCWSEILCGENTRSRACGFLEQIWTIIYHSSACRSRYETHSFESATITGSNYIYKWRREGLSEIGPSFHNLVINWLKIAMVQDLWSARRHVQWCR